MTTDTLFLGRTLNVRLLDGTAAEFKVHQLRLGQYEDAFKLLDDEIALTAFICGHDRAWADTLQPESYEAVYAAAQEVNAKGFFAWSARRKERERQQQEAAIAAMAQLPPDMVKVAMQTAQPAAPSPSGLPRPRSR